jgi:hypothetical protein
MTTKNGSKRVSGKRLALEALADPADERDPATIESDLGLVEGQLEQWLKKDSRFRKKLADSMSPEHFLLTRSSIMKSLAAKAREGSIQHQKYFLELDQAKKGSKKVEKMVVELRITPVDSSPKK